MVVEGRQRLCPALRGALPVLERRLGAGRSVVYSANAAARTLSVDASHGVDPNGFSCPFCSYVHTDRPWTSGRPRLWLAAEARAIGRGGLAAVTAATGVLRKRIGMGIHELPHEGAGVAAEGQVVRRVLGAFRDSNRQAFRVVHYFVQANHLYSPPLLAAG